ncbi:MAG: protein-glutamate O-methyltransferase CheR [Pirellulales bacterium]|nr:protein-glutamate O-methyltransferase CheR [Pirellulales bacterium]
MELSRATFEELRRLIHRLCGIVIADEKEYLVRHRLEPLVKKSGCSTFDEFQRKLASLDGLVWQEAIVEAITTQETSFFRDRHPFEALRSRILPELVSAAQSGKAAGNPRKIRTLCCGTATGQEPYSLAMLICDYLATRRPAGIEAADFSILATDISAAALAAAAAAKYGRRDVERGLTPAEIERFFERQGEEWTILPAVRKLVEFRRINLLQPLVLLGTFQLILCRNVLIYFDLPARQRICDQFHEMLAAGGWLVLGSAESLFGIDNRFVSLRVGDTLLFRKPG